MIASSVTASPELFKPYYLCMYFIVHYSTLGTSTCFNVLTLGPIAFKSSLFKPSCHLSIIHRQDLLFKTGFYILRPNLRIGRAVLKVAVAVLKDSSRVGQHGKKRRGMIFLAGIEIDQRMSNPGPSVWPARTLVSPRTYGTAGLSGLNLRCVASKSQVSLGIRT